MKYPFTISDEPQMKRLIRDISTEVVSVMLQKKELSKGKEMLKKADCYRMLSRRKVDDALKCGELKFVVKKGTTYISRIEFEKWLKKDTWNKPSKTKAYEHDH